MAKLALLAGPPLPRRSYGIVNTTVATNAVARAFAQPVMPRTTPQAGGTITVAQLAAVWGTLTSAQQLGWNGGIGPTSVAYSNFFAYNQNVATWGYPIFENVPTVPINLSTSLYFLTSEADKIHTTFTCFGLNTGTSGLESWVQLYLNLSTLSGTPPTNNNGDLYVGKFGPNPSGVATEYDITALWTSLVGQWAYPASFDTTLDKRCGGNLYGRTADTDQFGRAYDLIFQPNPSAEYFLGMEGGTVGPGACFGQPLHSAAMPAEASARALWARQSRARAILPLPAHISLAKR
jgi:hypothetical protein